MCVNNLSKVARYSAAAGIESMTRELQSEVQRPKHCATEPHPNTNLTTEQPTWKDAVIYGRPQQQCLSFRRCRDLPWVILLSPVLHRVHGTVYHHLFELFPPSFHSDTS